MKKFFEKADKNSVNLMLFGVILLLLQGSGFMLARIISSRLHEIIYFCPKIPQIDERIPIVPVFVIPYIWAFVFWSMSPAVLSRCGKTHLYKSLSAYFITFLISTLIFLFFPSYMNRISEGIWDSEHTGLFWFMMKTTYFFDGKETGGNLLPSLHCSYSIISFLGVYRQEKISRKYRIYALVTAVLICLSTLFIKQHYFADVVTGCLLGCIVYCITMKYAKGTVPEKILDPVFRKFHIFISD